MTSPQKILVTGATGLIGTHLLHALLQNGYDVKALYRSEAQIANSTKIVGFYGSQAQQSVSQIEWVKGDVCDYFSIMDALDGVDWVFHCAAMVSFDPRDKKEMFLVNDEGTANVVNASLAMGVKKLCHVSSIGTLGKPVNSHSVDEDTAWQSDDDHSQYSLSKFKAEMEVWRGTKEGLPAIVVNPGVVIGAGDNHRSSGALFGKVLKGLNYYTNGITGFVDVRDVANFMVMAMESQRENERYVLVSENLSYKTLLTNVANALNVTPPLREASPLLTGLAWRIDKMMYWLLGKKPSFTRENARTSHAVTHYTSKKAKEHFAINFSPINQAIADTAAWLNQFN
jgi:dihydroflavonol-4-reductase